ncbi:MAG: hypothetical protein O9318_01855 [Hylemonella sp.]|uniref:hypothetical protein n=1 Tax=Hylemonella sp. TaxID=2066020 RepID=UPI0022C0616B|nr:hypothetical protein [Hylemonella sp.]MCZ8251192.1 hypothetical protein [Hylemonella sp.]
MKTVQPTQRVPGAGVHALAVGLLLILGLLAAADWSGQVMSQYGARLTWSLLLCWAMLTTWLLHGSPRPLAMLVYAALIPLGLVPWIGLLALLLLPITLLTFLLGSLLALIPTAVRTGLAAMSLATVAALGSLLTLVGPASCADITIVHQLPAHERIDWAVRTDQEDRRTACFVFNPQRDAKRRDTVKTALEESETLPVSALRDAGLVLLHSSKEDDLALALGALAEARLMGDTHAAVLEKVAIDRLLLAKGQPQVHQTQWLHAR